MKIRLKTLVPLWTGGLKPGKMDGIHETGIIGSLRWWYEVVVRGLGGEACDPTENECTYEEDERDLCDVCQVFGATGWRRRFKLILSEEVQNKMSESLFLPSLRLHRRRNDEMDAGGWHIMPGVIGSLIIEPVIEEKHRLLLAVLSFMESWTAIGAKTISGYGVFKAEVIEKDHYEKQICVNLSEEDKIFKSHHKKSSSPDRPKLTDFFFSKIRFKASEDFFYSIPEIAASLKGKVDSVDIMRKKPLQKVHLELWMKEKWFPLSPVIRNWMRYTLFNSWNGPKGNFLFGTSDKICPMCFNRVAGDSCHICETKQKPIQRMRSKIGISHGYKIDNDEHSKDMIWEFRIWGYIPKTDKPINKEEREEFLTTLKNELSQNGCLWETGPLKGAKFSGLEWREFDSARDMVGQFTDPWLFFKSLLPGGDKI